MRDREGVTPDGRNTGSEILYEEKKAFLIKGKKILEIETMDTKP